MLETEIKSMLDENTYEKLRSEFTWDNIKEQVNSYYTDPDGILRANGITLRIRTKDGVNRIQIKTHKNSGSPLQISEENEFYTDTIPDSFTADEVRKMTSIDAPAYLIGSLTTLRHSLMYCDGVEICLDKSSYLGVTDHEIEVEYTKPIPENLIKKLNDLGVKFDSPAIGKFSRFMIRSAETSNKKQ